MIVFVSGHLDVTREEFEEHYVPLLCEAILQGASFVVGDARGADTMAQAFLHARGVQNVTVYHMFTRPRTDVGFPTIGGFTSDEERDAAMTVASDRDVAWVRPGREKSGTAKNLTRREHVGGIRV